MTRFCVLRILPEVVAVPLRRHVYIALQPVADREPSYGFLDPGAR